MAIQIRRTRTPDLAPIGLVPGQLSVEMASNPPRLWCGVPSSIDSSERVLIGAVGAGTPGAGKTGDTKLTIKNYAESGWIIMNDGTIGDAESSASNRANDDCEALFDLLWKQFSHLTVLPERGASAAADWAAHKRIQLPRQAGRTMVVAGEGAGLTPRELGTFFGAETETQTVVKLRQHGHSVSGGSHNHVGGCNANLLANSHQYSNYGAAVWYPHYYGGFDATVSYHGVYTGFTAGFRGGSTPFNIMQPSAVWVLLIKL